jgi:hypothetical protein
MLLKRGDFIEDKFGQVQRNTLVNLRHDCDAVREVFKWYGSFVLWHNNDDTQETDISLDILGGREHVSEGVNGSVIFIAPCGDNGAGRRDESDKDSAYRDLRPSATMSLRSRVMVSHLRGRHYISSYSAIVKENGEYSGGEEEEADEAKK